jgi:Uma2 family endonuclease
MSTQPKVPLTPQEYLAIERKAEFKSEFFDGEMFAMSGASRNHNLLLTNLGAEFREQLRNRPCESYGSDMRVGAGDDYFYPDASVVCEKPLLADKAGDVLLNPVVIAEILSPSTEAYDRGKKFERYRRIASLRHYLLITQDRMHVELYTRTETGDWLLSEANGPEGVIELSSAGCRLALSDLYEKVDLAES